MKKQEYSKLFITLCAISITFMLTSNIVAIKPISLFGLVFSAATIFFPFTYILGDIITEVYGYKTSRFVIIMSFICNLLMVTIFNIAIAMPGSSEFTGQESMEAVLGSTPKVLVASFISYIVGSLVNAMVMSIMKVKTKGKYLILRTMTSTIIGAGIDTLIFIPMVFGGVLEISTLQIMMFSVFIIKVAIEIILMPVIYKIVAVIKKKENIDTYDNWKKLEA